MMVPNELGFWQADKLQKLFFEYVMEDGETTISREEAYEIYRRILKIATSPDEP